MKPRNTKNIRLLAAGLCFAALWPSASVATKIALQFSQPFVIAITRFFLAGIIMLFVTHIILRNKLPHKEQWKQLSLYGLLNITIYLGLYVLAMQNVSAGLGSLSIAANPVFISIISALWFKEVIKPIVVVSLLFCFTGIIIAAYPLLLRSYATPAGLVLLITCMLSYSAGAIYFSRSQWNNLHILTINGWQTILGGLFLLPFVFYFYDSTKNHLTMQWAFCILWLAIPISIAAVQLWLFLLRDNPVKASFWLFLCPVFGFVLAALIMKEPLSLYTLSGVLFVITGLYLVQRKARVQA